MPAACGAEWAPALLTMVSGSALRSRELAETKRQFCFVGEEIEITFSYWDGSGHRRTVKVGSVDCALHSPGHCGPASLGAPWEGAFNPDLRTSPVLSCEWSLGILEGAEKRFWALVGVARGFRVPGQDFQATAFLRAPVQAAMFCPLPLTFPDVGARAAPVDEKGQHDAAVPAEGTGDPAQRLQRAQVRLRGAKRVCTGVCSHARACTALCRGSGSGDPEWWLVPVDHQGDGSPGRRAACWALRS